MELISNNGYGMVMAYISKLGGALAEKIIDMDRQHWSDRLVPILAVNTAFFVSEVQGNFNLILGRD